MNFVTGDMHGLSFDYYAKEHILNNLGSDDNVIVAGDFGFIWNRGGKHPINLNDLATIKDIFPEDGPKILFIDGNHENHDALEALPVEKLYDGNVHRITDNVFHLMRGQVYNINGMHILTIGGALSIDRRFRKTGISWWPQELITQADIDTARKNLEKVNNTVDYIITHTCPQPILPAVLSYLDPFIGGEKMEDQSCLLLSKLPEIKYKKWYFGHFHIDRKIDDKHTAVYNSVHELI